MKYKIDEAVLKQNWQGNVDVAIAIALNNIANELSRRNDIEYADKINHDEDKFYLYQSLQEKK